MQFIILARDATDPEAPARRQQARAAHLKRALQDHRAGDFLFGGALLDEDGGMIGSVVVVDLPDKDAVREWITKDPYSRENVWHQIEILPFRQAVP